MSIDKNDWRLTAYALGELESPDREAFEAELAADPEAQAEVDAISALGSTLTEALQDAPKPVLAPEQREEIVVRTEPAEKPPRRIGRWLAVAGLAAAASVAGVMISQAPPERAASTIMVDEPQSARLDYSAHHSDPIPAITSNPARVDLKRRKVMVARNEQTHQGFRNDPLGGANSGGQRASAVGDGSHVVPSRRANKTAGHSKDQFIPQREHAASAARQAEPRGTETYKSAGHSDFKNVEAAPLSTFSTDVDTASYTNVRRMLERGQRPPQAAVRTEEFVNFFDYGYEAPTGEHPLAIHTEVVPSPWTEGNLLVRVGLQAKRISREERPPTNLVFLVDTSGSMNAPDKLPLLKRAMAALVEEIDGRDRIAIVTYAGSSGVALPLTSGNDKATIIKAFEAMRPGGSTNGAAGIHLAYNIAAGIHRKGSVTRVLLATDGDFNVGASSATALEELIVEKRKSGVFLTTLGFGSGNLQDHKLETLADKGNGQYIYIDRDEEADRVFGQQLTGTLIPVAKDTKVQVEFNPAHVRSYRLVGYENRALKARDFADDTKDAGDIGAGHSVTALYDVVPTGTPIRHDGVPLKYQKSDDRASDAGELLTVKVRYKHPESATSQLFSVPVASKAIALEDASNATRLAIGVATFAETLRGSSQLGRGNIAMAKRLVQAASQPDPHGEIDAFLAIMNTAERR
jgi:Ca-activated chloride channel family protein